MSADHIVILTGAGVSAESGLPTFRGPDGLWEGHRVEDVATPEAFDRDPHLVHRFYNLRRRALDSVGPNAAHLAIARLQRERRVTLVTQNVDDLHERAGSTGVIHMHGELRKALCTRCGARMEWIDDMEVDTPCPACGKTGGMRPDIVWFGEMPYRMEEIESALMDADLFAAIGTSGNVYPAAGFVRTARFAGARTIEFNNAGTAVSGFFEDHRLGPATVEVKRWVDNLLDA
ncbi:MAG: NAD-dependent deacylase [Akkermansiaceae bacterium]|nr:NAD-dependent deacylase [Akkermansiaceae bacterium]MCP5544097.1 NAD-dependent deacylase [Akkermansiaceae bacterium]MCP5547847.1 NAD-dependent deacylase [Akkermansiaceae bacterium]